MENGMLSRIWDHQQLSLSIVDPKQAFDKSTTPSVSLACRCSNIT